MTDVPTDPELWGQPHCEGAFGMDAVTSLVIRCALAPFPPAASTSTDSSDSLRVAHQLTLEAAMRPIAMHYRLLRSPALLLLLLTLCAAAAPRAEAQVSVLVDASRDAGVWWAPQSGTFDPSQPHQGKDLADYMRGQGMQVTELSNPSEVTCALLSQYQLVMVANGCGSYSGSELAAYSQYVSNGGRLVLLAEFACALGNLPPTFGLGFSGVINGPITTFNAHPITAGVAELPFIFGGAVVAAPPSATTLGFIGGTPVMGIMSFGSGQVFYVGDTNGIEGVPQPFVDNLLGYMLGGAQQIPCGSTPAKSMTWGRLRAIYR